MTAPCQWVITNYDFIAKKTAGGNLRHSPIQAQQIGRGHCSTTRSNSLAPAEQRVTTNDRAKGMYVQSTLTYSLFAKGASAQTHSAATARGLALTCLVVVLEGKPEALPLLSQDGIPVRDADLIR